MRYGRTQYASLSLVTQSLDAYPEGLWVDSVLVDSTPTTFIDSILDVVAGHDMYNFLDGFSGYNQVRIHPDDQEKTTFVTD